MSTIESILAIVILKIIYDIFTKGSYSEALKRIIYMLIGVVELIWIFLATRNQLAIGLLIALAYGLYKWYKERK